MDTMYRSGLGEEEHMLCFFCVCVSKLKGEPLVNIWLFIIYELFTLLDQ